MTNPLDNTNSHGIRVVADRAPLREALREDVKVAFAKGSRKATTGIKNLTQPQRRSRSSATAKRTTK